MGRYDGLLICSDFDGTLARKGQVPKENIEAIKTFQAEGGRFTLCTGRQPSLLSQLAVDVPVNAPVICLNGAILYDKKTERILHEDHMDASAFCALYPMIRAEFPDLERIHGYIRGQTETDRCLSDEMENIHALFQKPLYKMVFIVSSEPGKTASLRSQRLRERLQELTEARYEIARSWNVGVEIQGSHYHKGLAARRLQSGLGADKLICVGDYENDISMLKEADLSFATGNALDSVKAAADHILCSAEDGAIADLISRL